MRTLNGNEFLRISGGYDPQLDLQDPTWVATGNSNITTLGTIVVTPSQQDLALASLSADACSPGTLFTDMKIGALGGLAAGFAGTIWTLNPLIIGAGIIGGTVGGAALGGAGAAIGCADAMSAMGQPQQNER